MNLAGIGERHDRAREAAELSGLFTHDAMAAQVMVSRKPPESRLDPVGEARLLRDPDVTAVQEWVQRNGLGRVGKETM